jgi:hypothetical protein
MEIDFRTYVPVLKWRMGEYQALYRLSSKTKESITPLIIVPPIEFDFEKRQPKRTIDQHIPPFPKKFEEKWGEKKALIDLHESLQNQVLSNGTRILEHIFGELRQRGCLAIPVSGLSREKVYTDQVKRVTKENELGVCLRIGFNELVRPDLNTRLKGYIEQLEINPSKVDLVLDLGEPENFNPVDVLANLVLSKMGSIVDLESYRSLIVAGMSLKLSEVKKPGGEVPRLEWAMYKEMLSSIKDIRVPSYGDYTIETPKFFDTDMRLLNPAGKIVYTCDDTWLIPKGGSFREDSSQMKAHCEKILNSAHFSGEKFSFGDKRISNTAKGKDGFGNQTTWKQVAVNHHIEKVVDQLARYPFP